MVLLIDVSIASLRCRLFIYVSVVGVTFSLENIAIPFDISSEKLVKLSLPISVASRSVVKGYSLAWFRC